MSDCQRSQSWVRTPLSASTIGPHFAYLHDPDTSRIVALNKVQ